MAQTKWVSAGPDNWMAFVDDGFLYVCQSGLHWNWGYSYYEDMELGVCKTERGAKWAASHWFRRKHDH